MYSMAICASLEPRESYIIDESAPTRGCNTIIDQSKLPTPYMVWPMLDCSLG